MGGVGAWRWGPREVTTKAGGSVWHLGGWGRGQTSALGISHHWGPLGSQGLAATMAKVRKLGCPYHLIPMSKCHKKTSMLYIYAVLSFLKPRPCLCNSGGASSIRSQCRPRFEAQLPVPRCPFGQPAQDLLCLVVKTVLSLRV